MSTTAGTYTKSRHATLEGMEQWITRCVLRGDLDAARQWATDYAMMRDELLTWPELRAAVTA